MYRHRVGYRSLKKYVNDASVKDKVEDILGAFLNDTDPYLSLFGISMVSYKRHLTVAPSMFVPTLNLHRRSV